MAIQQRLNRKDISRPMFGHSNGRIACTSCGNRVPFGAMICWYRHLGWTCVRCCQVMNLPHFAGRGHETDGY
jgi:hypothetical protein